MHTQQMMPFSTDTKVSDLDFDLYAKIIFSDFVVAWGIVFHKLIFCVFVFASKQTSSLTTTSYKYAINIFFLKASLTFYITIKLLS